MRMRHIAICALTRSIQHFATSSHKRHDFREGGREGGGGGGGGGGKLLKIKYVLIFSTIYVWNIFHSKNSRARYDKKKCISVFTYSTDQSCKILM